jgi:hypothetical protein
MGRLKSLLRQVAPEAPRRVPVSQTPTSQTPTSQTPTSQTPTSQTPTSRAYATARPPRRRSFNEAAHKLGR